MNDLLLRLLVAALLSTFFQSATVWAEPVSATITSLDPRFNRLIPRDAKLERIADGFTWVEGPVWHKQGGYLLFSDIPANSVYKWKSGEGVSLFVKNSGYSGTTPFAGKEPGSNGLTLDAQGRLVLCRHGDRQIGRLESNGTIVPSPATMMGTRSTVRTIWCINRTAICTSPIRRLGSHRPSTIPAKPRCKGSIVCPKMAQ